MSADFHTRTFEGHKPLGCVEMIESVDDGGWYAHEYDFTRTDSATRVSRRIYPTRAALVAALNSGKHKWERWS